MRGTTEPATLRRAVVLAALSAAACAGSRARPTAPLAAGPTPVSPGAASVAWSPDGAALAVVQRGGVVVLELATGRSRAVSSPGAVAVDWSPARALLVTERDARGGRVVELAPDGGGRHVLHEDPNVVVSRWLHAGAGWAAVAATRDVRSYGTYATLTLTVALARAAETTYRWSAVLPIRESDTDPGTGWRDARPNPVDHGFLLPELRRPALLAPYVELVSIDPFHPVPVEVARLDGGGAATAAVASWAPDGRRAAVGSGDGTLRVLGRDGKLTPARGAVAGLHPSWHPVADAIFFGGWLLDGEGAPIRQLLADARDAVGIWSPAGDRLAVVAGGELFVFGGLAPPAPADGAGRGRASRRAALWELGALRGEGLVAPTIYLERRDRLRSSPEER